MACATSYAECVDRHRSYRYDIAHRLIPLNRIRLSAMFAPVRDGESVLDVGCNSGYAVEFLPPGCRCHGVDVSAALVAKAQTRLASARVASAERLPWADRSIDVVALGEILEHVFDPTVALVEAKRVARRLVIGSTPHERSEWGPNGKRSPQTHQFHVRCFTRETLDQALRMAGCETFTITEIVVGGRPMFYGFEAAA